MQVVAVYRTDRLLNVANLAYFLACERPRMNPFQPLQRDIPIFLHTSLPFAFPNHLELEAIRCRIRILRRRLGWNFRPTCLLPRIPLSDCVKHTNVSAFVSFFTIINNFCSLSIKKNQVENEKLWGICVWLSLLVLLLPVTDRLHSAGLQLTNSSSFARI